MKPLTTRIRRWIIVAFVVAVFGVFVYELMRIQIVDAETYQKMLDGRYISTQTVKAVRGEIVDRAGMPLAVNRMGYDVVIDKAFFPSDRQNEILERLILLFEEMRERWTDNLPVSHQPPFSFESGYDAEISRLKQMLELQDYATADEVMYWLSERYGLSELPQAMARKIAGVRYEMERRDFSLRTPYIFATDIDIASVVQVKEHSYELSGVGVVESAIRINENGDVAPHIIGTVGPLYKEEYSSLREKGLIFREDADSFDSRGYTMDDTIGKSGIEKAMEEILRGYNGVREIAVDSSGSVVSATERIPAVPGNTVMLTIDGKLQRAGQEALAAQIDFLRSGGMPSGEGRGAEGGAFAMVHVKTGEVLALGTAPTYNLADYRQNYAQLLQQEFDPLFDRSVNGQYTPGSIFKPVVALAGLRTGVINEQSTVTCNQVYTFYEGHPFTCLSAHGAISLDRAISQSCNIFFYDVGQRAGIDAIDDSARRLGLGEPTGIEILEAAGQRSNPSVKEAAQGVQWYPGDTLQSAIGQLLNKYTPLQLANYTATVANRGKRMELTLIHEIRDYAMAGVVSTHQPAVASDMTEFYDPEAFEAVVRGMAATSQTGSARGTFINYPLSVGAKTGSPQVTVDEVNSTFICFAPAEDPEVAIAVIIERGGQGYTGAPVAKALMDAYFGIDVLAPNDSGPKRLQLQRMQEAALAALEEGASSGTEEPSGDLDPATPTVAGERLEEQSAVD